MEGLVLKSTRDLPSACPPLKPLVEGLVLKSERTRTMRRRREAPRGGAGIEIRQPEQSRTSKMKPLVEGLVLKSSSFDTCTSGIEAPRGGAGIEIL